VKKGMMSVGRQHTEEEITKIKRMKNKSLFNSG